MRDPVLASARMRCAWLALSLGCGSAASGRPPAIENHGTTTTAPLPKPYVGQVIIPTRLPQELVLATLITLASGAHLIGVRRGDTFVILLADDTGRVVDEVDQRGAWLLTAACDSTASDTVGLVAAPCSDHSVHGGSWSTRHGKLTPVQVRCDCIDL